MKIITSSGISYPVSKYFLINDKIKSKRDRNWGIVCEAEERERTRAGQQPLS